MFKSKNDMNLLQIYLIKMEFAKYCMLEDIMRLQNNVK